jgi:uncharacterized phage protein gp47/JayE
MTIVSGRFVGATKEEILDILMANAKQSLGSDLNDDELAVIRTFYDPVATLLADIQSDISAVLDSAQLDHAEGMALDLLVVLIGISRKPAYASVGEATFSRGSAASVDYTIPRNTIIQTDATDPVRFETTEKAVLLAGNTSVSNVPIKAVEPGLRGNVGADTLTVMTDAPAGIENATNPSQTDGGENEEADDDLRERAKSELSSGMRATAVGVRNQLLKAEGVRSVSLFINDTDATDGAGRPPQHTEYVVEGGTDAVVGQTLFDSKAAGDGTIGGVLGTIVNYDAEIGNGQTHPVEFTRANEIPIYVDMDLSVTNEYGGDEKVRDKIVRYIGGIISSGDEEDGTLRTGDDVVYTKVLAAIMSIDGVADATSLTIGNSASPTGTSNIAIAASEMATADATDGSITITEV